VTENFLRPRRIVCFFLSLSRSPRSPRSPTLPLSRSHLKYLSYTLMFSILRFSVSLGARGNGIYKPPLI
jgi:hypothetical protein